MKNKGLKNISSRRKILFFQLFSVILLITVGMVMIGRGFMQHGQLFLENQDEQIYYIARSVDQNIHSLLEQFEKNLRYVVGRQGFVEAQNIWEETGETEPLLFRLKENLLYQDEMISEMMFLKDNQVVLSTDGTMDYSFPDQMTSDTLIPCENSKGKVYLSFVHEVEDHLKYVAILDLNVFYDQIVSKELAAYDWVLLTDASGEILLQPQKGQVILDDVDIVSSATCGTEGVDILLDQQKQQTVGAASYEYVDYYTGEKYTARIVTIPSNETENKTFAVAVVANFNDVMEELNRSSIQLVMYSSMVAAGVLLLIVIVLHYRQRNERSLNELQILREKNEAMEELNRKTQELAHHQRLETIGTLTSSIAHEFNNLLTPIMGYSILTLEQLPPEDEDLYDNVLEIYNASCRASDIIARLSELSRKSTSLSYQRISMDDLIRKVLHVAMPACPVGVEMKEDLNCGSCRILGNETQLSQLVLNLVLNAFQAMESDGGTLTVSASVEKSNVVLSVEDTGVGIPSKILPNIFEPFFTTKETGKGTGLGLAIVQQVVSEHHGTIQVDSHEGVGTIFTVYLPLTPKEEKITDTDKK